MAADNDYDDSIPESPDWGYQWDPLEWEDLRASRRFAAFVRLAQKAARRLHNLSKPNPIISHDEADWLYEVAQSHPDLWERHEDAVWRLIAWLRAGAPKPKFAKLSGKQLSARHAATVHWQVILGRQRYG